ncbi:tryptophan--tRNA ligase [Candidatus Vidania fulgoroideorum]
MRNKVILTGDSPTGNLHIGHYFGSIKKRIKYQKKNKLFIIIADNQAFSNKRSISSINRNVLSIVIEYLAIGIKARYSNIFLQSKIPELSVFNTIFLNFVNYNFLLKNPTIKNEISIKKNDKNLGFVTYPVSQAADILSFKADYTIVGKDQTSIIEQVNIIANRINRFFDFSFFKKCKIIKGRKDIILGIYGRNKMSKSLNNSIDFRMNREFLSKTVRKIFTDPNRIHKNQKGNHKNNMVFKYLSLLNYFDIDNLKKKYSKGYISDLSVKKILEEELFFFINPIRKKILEYEKNLDYILEVIKNGTKVSRNLVIKTLESFKNKIGFNFF